MSLLALHPTRIARRCSRSLAHRAVVFRTHGDPLDVLHVRTLPDLQHAPRDSVLIRFLCATVNPSDLNVIEGTYPLKPKPRQEGLYVPGNEGLAEVVAVGDDGKLKIGDWVILKSPQLGSWATCALVQQRDIVRVPDDARDKLSCEQLVSITVNPRRSRAAFSTFFDSWRRLATALRMLEDFADLHAGDWVLQNGANSAVSTALNNAHSLDFNAVHRWGAPSYK
jgi:mitochondrial enoyl-[acyl-carrier protein] reductase / trans-2-enoyl-CoA reductase